MDTKRIAIGMVVGGFTTFAVGYLIWDVSIIRSSPWCGGDSS